MIRTLIRTLVRTTIHSIIVCGLLLLTFNVSAADQKPLLANWQSPLPRIQSIISDTSLLGTLGLNHIVVVHANSQNYTQTNQIKSQPNNQTTKLSESPPLPDKDINLIYAFTVVHASEQQVRDTLTNFNRYKTIMPHVIKSKIIHQQENHWLAKYQMTFQMPLISFKPKIEIQHSLLPNGDLIERRIKGDIKHAMTRWQVIPLGRFRCLLVQTSWADIGSISWLMRLVFSVQPDLERLSPLTSTALILQSLKQKMEEKNNFQYYSEFTRRQSLKHPFSKQRAAKKNINLNKPSIANPNMHLTALTSDQNNALAELAKSGTVNMISPGQVIRRTSKESIVLQPVLSAALIPLPMPTLQPRAIKIEDYAEKMDIVSSIKHVKNSQLHHSSRWELGFDFSIFTFNINFNIEGLWNHKKTELSFDSTNGNFDPLMGRINWYPVDQQTLVTINLAHNIADNSGFILQKVKKIPYSQMFAGVYIGTRLVEGQQQLAK